MKDFFRFIQNAYTDVMRPDCSNNLKTALDGESLACVPTK